MADSATWTKPLVQEHAQVAVAVELYTLPFYITALASIKPTPGPSATLTDPEGFPRHTTSS